MLALLLAAAAFVNDRYEPAGEVAWLCPQPEAAAEVGLKVDNHASAALVSALAHARKCVSWEAGAMKIRGAQHLGAQEVGLIRVVYGSGPEVSYWVARNTVKLPRESKAAGRIR